MLTFSKAYYGVYVCGRILRKQSEIFLIKQTLRILHVRIYTHEGLRRKTEFVVLLSLLAEVAEAFATPKLAELSDVV